ncbi:hypothetical protein B6U74_05995 [Candidatus Bathyarchaeota archaeon ex4484_205]|nr:MAG: hypothetical protein B6U74_05995 [Candidatus Bathyarchaeota archaeon ex4484_205]
MPKGLSRRTLQLIIQWVDQKTQRAWKGDDRIRGRANQYRSGARKCYIIDTGVIVESEKSLMDHLISVWDASNREKYGFRGTDPKTVERIRRIEQRMTACARQFLDKCMLDQNTDCYLPLKANPEIAPRVPESVVYTSANVYKFVGEHKTDKINSEFDTNCQAYIKNKKECDRFKKALDAADKSLFNTYVKYPYCTPVTTDRVLYEALDKAHRRIGDSKEPILLQEKCCGLRWTGHTWDIRGLTNLENEEEKIQHVMLPKDD